MTNFLSNKKMEIITENTHTLTHTHKDTVIKKKMKKRRRRKRRGERKKTFTRVTQRNLLPKILQRNFRIRNILGQHSYHFKILFFGLL